MSLKKLLSETEKEALANCDRHPIRTPGYIQPFGSLIGIDLKTWDVSHVAENAEAYFHRLPADILGQDAGGIFGRELLHTIRNFSSRSTAALQREIVGSLATPDGEKDITAHVRGETAILEISGDGDISSGQSQSLDRLRWLTARIRNDASVQSILEKGVADLRTFTGYDRVKAYRFRPDGSGEVIAEDRDADIDSYLGLRFPEFDIPPTARVLYSKTPIRMISDVDGAHIPLLSTNAENDLDMSLAILRGCMPIHCDYLRNMNIRGSLSLPIVVNGDLWGLFAFHDRQPRYLGGGAALALEFAGQFLNIAINNAVQQDIFRGELKATAVANVLFAKRDEQSASTLAWNAVKEKLLDVIPANGVAFCWRGHYAVHGDCPSLKTLEEIASVLPSKEGELALADNLPALLPESELGNTAGALKATIGEGAGGEGVGGEDADAHILFFRKEAADTTMWAGTPDKAIDSSDGETRLIPRSSFAAFKEEMAGRADSWENSDVIAVKGLQQAIARAHREAGERDALLENLGLVVQELHHRVRNILALVQSIILQSRPEGSQVTDYVTSLEARILSLATAHDLLTETSDLSVDLGDVFRREAAPYSDHKIQIDGPPISIAASGASVFVLTVHELFSNAAKYGALSEHGKRLSVRWELVEEGLMIHWDEQVNHKIQPPTKQGFGSTLIENAFAYEFNGTSTLSFRPDGLLVELFLPKAVLRLSDMMPEGPWPITSNANDNAPEVRARRGVLLVEDDFVIAQSTKAALVSLGYETVFVAGSQTKAFEAIAQGGIGLAVLDVNLNGASSDAVAYELQRQAIPFVFVTGYSRSQSIVSDFADVPLLTKPIRTDQLGKYLKEIEDA